MKRTKRKSAVNATDGILICIGVALLIATALLAGGCASYPGERERSDGKAVEHYERVAHNCDGKVFVKRTGTRIRKAYTREDMLSAKCVQ